MAETRAEDIVKDTSSTEEVALAPEDTAEIKKPGRPGTARSRRRDRIADMSASSSSNESLLSGK